MSSTFPGAVPEIPVRDITEATAYYESRLGFTVDWAEQELGLAGISRGDCRMFLANAAFRQGRGNAGPVVIWLNLDSKDDVDALYRAWHEKEATVISPPESKSWGLHEFTAADVDGNLYRVFYDFATPAREAGD